MNACALNPTLKFSTCNCLITYKCIVVERFSKDYRIHQCLFFVIMEHVKTLMSPED